MRTNFLKNNKNLFIVPYDPMNYVCPICNNKDADETDDRRLNSLQIKILKHSTDCVYCCGVKCILDSNHKFINIWSENFSREIYYRVPTVYNEDTNNIIYSLYLRMFPK